MWNLEETSKARLLVLRRLMLSYKVLVLQTLYKSSEVYPFVVESEKTSDIFLKSIIGTMLFIKEQSQ